METGKETYYHVVGGRWDGSDLESLLNRCGGDYDEAMDTWLGKWGNHNANVGVADYAIHRIFLLKNLEESIDWANGCYPQSRYTVLAIEIEDEDDIDIEIGPEGDYTTLDSIPAEIIKIKEEKGEN